MIVFLSCLDPDDLITRETENRKFSVSPEGSQVDRDQDRKKK